MALEGKADVIVLKGSKEIKGGEKRPYNFFGETAFFSEDKYSGAIKVAEELTCLGIDRETFSYFTEKYPEFSQFFLKALGEKIRNFNQSSVKSKITKEKSEETPYSIEGSYLRRDVEELMTSKVIKCYMVDSVQKAARLMKEYGISSVVVVDEREIPRGIITEQDLAYKVVVQNLSSEDLKVKDILNEMFTLSPGDDIYNALILMLRNKIKHLVVTESNKLKGIISLTDLIGPRRIGLLNIINDIDRAWNINDLLKTRKNIDVLIEELVEDGASARMICKFITEFFDRLTKKVIKLSEESMEKEGYGLPPVEYSFINMGSSGRKEQFMTTDQDNGIIYQDIENIYFNLKEENVNNYFSILGKKIVEGLYQIGFEKCPGGVMVSNPKWCSSLETWKEEIKQWAYNPKFRNIRNMTIFLDFRHIYGNSEIADSLKNFAIKRFSSSDRILRFLAEDDLNRIPPLGLFNQFKAQRDEDEGYFIDLKKSACVHIVDCLRLFSLKEGILETNTHERLDSLQEMYVFSRDDEGYIKNAYETIMLIRITDSINKLKLGKQPDNRVILKKLTKQERNQLKESLQAVKRLQSLTNHAFLSKSGKS